MPEKEFDLYLSLLSRLLRLSPEQKASIDNELRDFRLGGAELDAVGKERFRQVREREVQVSTRFAENVLDATNAFALYLDDASQLAGVPDDVLALYREAAAADGKPGYKLTLQEPYVVCVELSLAQGKRHQAIFLSEMQDDDGRDYLRVSTAIAPTTGLDARRALAFNWESRVGFLAIGELDGVPYLQLCENRPYDCLDAAEVDRLVLEIGGTGDEMERRMSAGGDLL